MTFGAAEPRSIDAPVSRVVGYLLGVAVLAGSLTLLFLSMRAVLDIGGACASGGPYVPRVECPDPVVAFTPLSIFTGLAGVGLMLWGGAALAGPWMSLVLLAWPALFVSLGWNFLQYGFVPPGGADGWIWSWLFCGVLFMIMGLGPLVGAMGLIRESGPSRDRAYAGGRVVVRPRSPNSRSTPAAVPSSPAPLATPTPDDEPAEDVVDRLERLAALRRAGDITNAEYEAAKALLLGGPSGASA